MTDTQWPRFEVFQQEAADRPHRHAGSVHAPDAEMALLNARDVFVRRPECSSLWVAPAAAITEANPEAGGHVDLGEGLPGGDQAAYVVFAKLEPRGTLTHVGEVSGGSPRAVIDAARQACAPTRPLVLWLVPAERLTRTEPEDSGPLFTPARDKPFRDQAFYRIQSALRRLRQDGGR
jgi:ring-1,2-phenylacetyl-CoA epoxidase subunit PaaB